MTMLAANCAHDPVDVIMGDWMSEANMTSRAALKTDNGGEAYEPTFIESLEPALPHIAKHHIKIAVNAGASDTALLHKVVTEMVKAQGLSLKVAWISGDEVLPAVQKAQREGNSTFENICTGEKLDAWKFEPIYAQAYLGGLGIAAAFAEGADIVVCGRVSDASPVIGAAYWWHGWKRDQLLELANAFVAGHLIECSNYVCGGNFTGFKSLETKGWDDIGERVQEVCISTRACADPDTITQVTLSRRSPTMVKSSLRRTRVPVVKLARRRVPRNFCMRFRDLGTTTQTSLLSSINSGSSKWALIG